MTEEMFEPLLRRLRVRRVISYIPQGSVICDIGCGMRGGFLKSLGTHVARGIGFDKKVKKQKDGNIILKKLLLRKKIPLPNESVDCVTMLAVWEHVDHLPEIVQEAKRILRQGGVMLITTPTPKSKPILEFLAFKIGLISPVEIADHKRYSTRKEMECVLRDAGFSTIVTSTFEFGLNNFVRAYK